ASSTTLRSYRRQTVVVVNPAVWRPQLQVVRRQFLTVFSIVTANAQGLVASSTTLRSYRRQTVVVNPAVWRPQLQGLVASSATNCTMSAKSQNRVFPSRESRPTIRT
ncbi:MAG: hypothetical protein AAF497_17980, partial [Planctomycetota bacterium]